MDGAPFPVVDHIPADTDVAQRFVALEIVLGRRPTETKTNTGPRLEVVLVKTIQADAGVQRIFGGEKPTDVGTNGRRTGPRSAPLRLGHSGQNYQCDCNNRKSEQ